MQSSRIAELQAKTHKDTDQSTPETKNPKPDQPKDGSYRNCNQRKDCAKDRENSNHESANVEAVRRKRSAA